MKSAQTQAKDQRKLLYQTEIELATSRQLVLDLRAELQKAKEAAEAERQASYTLSVEETQARLTEELAEVCRDYWDEALNVVGAPANSA